MPAYSSTYHITGNSLGAPSPMLTTLLPCKGQTFLSKCYGPPLITVLDGSNYMQLENCAPNTNYMQQKVFKNNLYCSSSAGPWGTGDKSTRKLSLRISNIKFMTLSREKKKNVEKTRKL